MIWLFTAILWFGLLTMRAPGRWVLTVFEISLFALAAVLIVKRRDSLRFHPIAVLLSAAAVWGLLQIAAAQTVDVQHTLESILHWTTNCAAFSIGLALTQERARRSKFLSWQLIFAAVLSIVALIGLLTLPGLSPFVYRNQFAAYIESMLGVAVAAAVGDTRRSLLWIMVAGIMFASVVAAGSRTGAFICLFLLILLPLLAFARKWISRESLGQVALLGAAAILGMVAVAGWETIWMRLQEPDPYGLRANLLRSSLSMTQDRPLLGFGLGTWSDAYPAYARFDDGSFVNQAHNDWVQWAAEGGVPFFLMMAAIVALLIRPAWRSLWGLGLMAVFVHAFVDYPMQQRPALAAFFFAIAGTLAAEDSTD